MYSMTIFDLKLLYIFAASVKTESRDLNISYGCIRVFGIQHKSTEQRKTQTNSNNGNGLTNFNLISDECMVLYGLS